MNTLQHESLSLQMSADGRCHHSSPLLRQSLADKSVTSLEIILDANHLCGGKISSILGDETSYLPSSAEFTLDHFEPKEDGTCVLHYTRCDPTSDNALKQTSK